MLKKILILHLFITHILVSTGYSNKIDVIKNPKPTHFAKNFVQLKKIKSINIDIDDDNFIGKISSTAIDNKGNLFIFDELQATIFKFDSNLRYIKKFGRRGQGPGEFAVRFSSITINVGRDNLLYVSDQVSKRLHVYDLNGQFIIDHKINYHLTFKPLVSKRGDFYIPSKKGDGIIDVFNKNMGLETTLLKRSAFYRFLFKKPGKLNLFYLTKTDYGSNILYDLSPDDKLLILIINDLTLYMFYKFKLIRKISIMPDLFLKTFDRDYLKDLMESDDDTSYIFVRKFFLDEDNYKYFYIQFLKNIEENTDSLYKFSLDGRLLDVFYVKHTKEDIYLFFLSKKNNTFYAMDRENIILYKEVKK